jgi:lipopolysaccharide/colanic/teichoic acid biosynthesis glycosyltransferase
MNELKHNTVQNELRSMEICVSSYVHSRLKRSIDIFTSVIGLLVVLFLYPIVSVAIKTNSTGPVLYRQNRLGLNGAVFEIVKFRTMRLDAESDGVAKWASTEDSRVTSVGKILRRLYIDEFPQWWNVLVGEMSFVGPRPERPEFASVISEHYPEFPNRLKTKPGITGLAQTQWRLRFSVRLNGLRTNSIVGSLKIVC